MTADGWVGNRKRKRKEQVGLFPLAYPFCDVSVCSKFNAKAAATASMENTRLG